MSIKVDALTKVYGTQKAVDNVSFELKKGEIVGFLGPNGAGKSTTMKIITGYLPPTDGKASVCGFDSQAQPMEARKRLGYLPEANPLYYDMYVREYLEFAAGIHQLGKDTARRIAEMIELTGLGKEAHKRIGMLSKGYKQRVGLAQAMLHNPEVLILDEPTSGLDPNQLVDIRDLIISIGREKTVLLSTHIMQEVQAMCSRVIIINGGRVVADDSIDRLQQIGTENTLLITLEAEIGESAFKALKGVKKIERINALSWKLSTDQPDELRREVMAWALKNDISIRSLQAESQSLEDVFRQLTTN